MKNIANKIDEIQDIRSEAGVIATLIQNPEYIWHSNDLEIKHFFDKINGYIYFAISQLVIEQNIKNIDAYNIINVLVTNGFIDEKTTNITPSFLNSIIENGYIIARNSVEEYKVLVENIIDKSLKRDIYSKLKNFEQLCLSEKRTDIQSDIYNEIDLITSQYYNIERIPEIKDIIDVMWQDILNRRTEGEGCGLKSKIETISNYYTYEPGELVLVCAKRKKGKSVWGLNELVYQLQNGKSVVYIDTEMSTRQQFERLLGYLTKIKVRDIKNGSYLTAEQGKIDEAMKWLKSTSYVHIYMPNPDLNKIYTIVRKYKKLGKIDFFIYDYIKSQKVIKASEVYHVMGETCNFLKNRICGELDIPGLALAQLNRNGDIGDSFKLEQYASTVAVLENKTEREIINDTEECGNYKFFIKLNRLGPQMEDIETDYIDLNFDGDTVTFTEANKQHAEHGLPV